MAEQRAPERSLRPCAKPGCAALVRPPARYCDAHAHLARHAAAESAPLQAPPFRLGRQPHMAHTLGIPPGSKNRAPVRPW
jgi:hypothetical protein